MLDRKQIMERIPHRPPFLWIDAITDLEPGVRCKGYTLIEQSAEFFRGHFPDSPVLPGIFMIEAAAQVAGVMMATDSGISDRDSKNDAPQYLLAAVNRFKFLKTVKPGETIHIETTLIKRFESLTYVSATIFVKDLIVAQGELSLARV